MKTTSLEKYTEFHNNRREIFLKWIDDEVDELVKQNMNDTPGLRYDVAIRGMAELIQFKDSFIWESAWTECEKYYKKNIINVERTNC